MAMGYFGEQCKLNPSLYLGVFFRLTRSNSGTTLLRGGGTVRASFSLLRSAKNDRKVL